MNKSQAEKKVYVFHAVFRVDVNDDKPFQNPTEASPFDHFLGPQSMPRLFKTNKLMADSNLHFPIGILGQVWYLIVSIPDLCNLTYFY